MQNVSQPAAADDADVSVVAHTHDEEPPPFKTLRLTLAMRGGVSLAVWIGGVVAELDLFRRAGTVAAGMTWDVGDDDAFLVTTATDPSDRVDRAKKYRELLEKARYRGVEIDILAGASAGGLNAVLYGLSQASRSVLDETVRRTWINEGGIWELLHPSVGKKLDSQSRWDWSKSLVIRRLKSVLQGDTRLYKVAYDALCELNVPEGAGPPRQYGVAANRPYNISIELAATLLDDVYSPGRGNRAGFSFRRTAGDLASGYSNIPSATDQDNIALTRLALAARSTSSFPGAFEPAQLRSTTTRSSVAGLLTNMAPVFPHARQQSAQPTEGATDNPFLVVDGGIFDNIPIDRAIRAIRRAPSALPTERRLVYIDPEPPSAPTPVGFNSADVDEVTGWLPVIRASSALQKRSETAADELSQLREHNDNVRRTQGRLEALASRLGAAGAATPVKPAAYAQYRIGSDATRIGDLLCDPWSYVCQPPRYSGDYHALPAEQAVCVGNEVREAYNALPDNWPLSHDVYAVLDQIRLMISWVRELERLVPQYATNPPSPIEIDIAVLTSKLESWKCRLYRYLLVATEARQQTIDLVLTERLEGPVPQINLVPYASNDRTGASPESNTLAGAILISQVKQHALTIPGAVVRELKIDPPPETDVALYSALAAWITGAAEVPGEMPPVPLCGLDDNNAAQVEPYGEQRFCPLMSSDLDSIRIAIRDGSSELTVAMSGIASSIEWIRRWKESVFPHFYSNLDLNIVPLATIFAETGTPDTAALVMYEEITSDLEPNLPAELPGLEPIRRAARAKHLQRWLRREPNQKQVDAVIGDPRSVMNADAKLAGNELSRFGGFFLARWRENDWQWGRMDAAAGIVQILQPSTESGEVLQELQGSIMNGANVGFGAEDQFLPLRVGTETLDSIDPHYRFALASRAVPLVFRALLPAALLSPVAVMQRIAVLLVRLTLGVIAPLTADPLRLAVAVTVTISAAGLLGGGHTDRAWLVVPAGLTIAILIRTTRAEKRWRLLGRRLGGCAAETTSTDRTAWCDVYENARRGIRGSRWCRTYSWVLGGLAAGVTIVGWFFYMPPLATLLLLVAAISGLHLWCMGCTYRIRGAPTVDQTLGEAIRYAVGNLKAGIKADSHSPERTRALRPAMSVGVLLTALACSYVAHLIATKQSDAISGFPDPYALTGGLPAAGVAAIATGILTFNSLWGWAQNWAAIAVTMLATALGGWSQWGLDDRLADAHAVFDLLPMLIWLLVIGLLAQYIPCRLLDAGRTERHTSYGEKNRPVIRPSS